MTIKTKLAAIGTAILTALSAIFYFLFRIEKQKADAAEQEKEKAISDTETIEAVNQKYVEEIESNEELEQKSYNNDADGFNASLELMHKLSQKDRSNNS